MSYFPYDFRRNQREIISEVANTIRDRRHFVFESGTGSGKTVCVLTAALPYALENQKRIVYATRTNAQQRQVLLELRAIKNKAQDDRLYGVGIQGRSNMCLLARNNPDIENGTSEELSRFCSNQKKLASSRKGKGCSFYRPVLNDKQLLDRITTWAHENMPTAEEFITYCEQHHICPYEINKLLIDGAILVVVPYVYVFDKSLRIMLFDWLSVSESDVILLVDEAHNLPDYLRDLYSTQLSSWMLNSCVSEAEKYGNPTIAQGNISVGDFSKFLIELIINLRDTYVLGVLENGLRRNILEKGDAFLPSHELETELLSRLKISTATLRDITNDLIAYGEKIQEYRQKEGKLPRSYLHKLGCFLQFWTTVETDQYIKLVVDASQGRNPRIEAYCLDPSLGAGVVHEFHSSIHMSGTLEPLEEYRDSLGLSQNTELVSYPSPFPRENRQIYFVRDATTRYEEIVRDKTVIPRMWRYITEVCNEFPKNTMVFYPSFNILSMFQDQGSFPDIQRCLYVEKQEMSQTELMDLVSDFKTAGVPDGDGAALFSVMGGRISEGMDFPAEQLEIAIIVGVPYPKPTARQRGLQKYYDLKFCKGWEYTVEAPAARKMLQSIGRLIRNENDRGIAVILDKRAQRFKRYISDMQESKNLIDDIHSFMRT